VIVRPGINAVRLAAGLGVLSLLGFVTAHAAWLLLAGVAAGLVLAWRDRSQFVRQFDGLRLTRQCPKTVGRGDPFRVTWTISTTGEGKRRVVGEFRDLVPAAVEKRLVIHPFALGDAQSFSQEFVLPFRGRHTFGPMWVRLRGPLGFLDAQREFAVTSDVRVLPETFASPDRFRKDVGAEVRMLDKPVFVRQHGEGTEFESLREYRAGDDPRRIDWRATARMQRPIIRKFQVERHRDVMILVDCGRLMGSHTERGTKLDCAVDAALLLGRIALQGGDRCGFALFDHSVRGYLPPVSGAASLPALVECVYDARVDWGESDFAPLFATLQSWQAKRSLIVVLSDLLDEQTSQQFRGSLRRLSQRHVVLLAALRTPLLRRVLARPIETLQDGAEQAVTFRLLHERDEALQTLRHAGVQVLDVEPQQLTAPLINQFIAIRRGNLL
jgi:uncharacterized protein (DUF58 family)